MSSMHRGKSCDVLVTNHEQVATEANRLRRMTMQVTSAGLARVWLQICALWRESWFISSLSYPNVSFTQHTVLCTEVTFHDDLVACAHKSHTGTSRSHAQPWQRGMSHLLGVKTTGVTQCKQNRHVPHVNPALSAMLRCNRSHLTRQSGMTTNQADTATTNTGNNDQHCVMTWSQTVC